MRFGQGSVAWQGVRRLRRDIRGVVALESALVGIPMIVLIGGTIFAGLNLTASTSLDNGVRDAARSIRLADDKGTTDEKVRNMICGYVKSFTTCDGAGKTLFINVQNGASFTALIPPVVTGGTMDEGFHPGASGNYVLMRVTMQSNLSLNVALHAAGMIGPVTSSTIVFRNE